MFITTFLFQVFVAPPLFRQKPRWYLQGLTQVSTRFSSVFTFNAPANLQLLPSFASQDLMPDGVHLTPVSGLHYSLHLFDQSESLLRRAVLSPESQLVQVQEQVRHHEDRMTFLESRHVGLHQQVSTKYAADAEFDDFVQNRNDEASMNIQGLPRLTNVTRQEWPEAVKRQVTDAIVLVLKANRVRLDFEVVHVYNPFTRTTSGPTVYNVLLDSRYSSKKIRELFSGFFRGHNPLKRPPALKGVSFRNKVTLETKVRIAILRQLGVKYLESNPGGSFKVKGFDPRPMLLTTPPRSSTERPRSYNFIQAVNTLRSNFDDANLIPIFQNIGDRFRGKLQSLFVILNDDDHDRCLELVKNSDRTRRPRFGPSQPSQESTSSGVVTGPGAGMDLESLRRPPPPPPSGSSFPVETENSRAHDTRVRNRREHERQPTPELDRGGLKRSHLSSASDDSTQRSSRSKKPKKSKV